MLSCDVAGAQSVQQNLDTRFTQTNQNTTNFSRLSTGSHVNNFLSRNKVSRVDRGDNIPSCSEHQSTSSVINRQAQLPLGRKIQQHRSVSLEGVARQPLRENVSNVVTAGPVLHAKRALFNRVLDNDRAACICFRSFNRRCVLYSCQFREIGVLGVEIS